VTTPFFHLTLLKFNLDEVKCNTTEIMR